MILDKGSLNFLKDKDFFKSCAPLGKKTKHEHWVQNVHLLTERHF